MSVTLSRAAECVGRPIMIDHTREAGVVARVNQTTATIWVQLPGKNAEEVPCQPESVTWIHQLDEQLMDAISNIDGWNPREDDDFESEFGFTPAVLDDYDTGRIYDLAVVFGFDQDGDKAAAMIVDYRDRRVFRTHMYACAPWVPFEIEERGLGVRP